MTQIVLPEGASKAQLRRVYRRANELLAKHDLPGWSVQWTDSPVTAGTCVTWAKVIELSAPLMSIWPWAECRDTTLHEIAHALTPYDRGHGGEWKRVAREIGARPERTYNRAALPQIPLRYEGICPKGHISYRQRKATRRVSCAACSSKFNPAYEFTWKDTRA